MGDLTVQARAQPPAVPQWYRLSGDIRKLPPMELAVPRVPPGESVRISGSTFVAWKKCPETANARLQGRYGPDTRSAFVGGLAHQIFSRHLNTGPISEDGFVQACREEIGGSSLNYRLGGSETKPSVLPQMIEEARSLYQRFIRFPQDGFVGAELSLGHTTEDGVELVGKVDAVYVDGQGHRLVDWKTGELGDVQDQLMFYALLWALERGEIPAAVEAISVGTGESHRSHPSEDEVRLVADEVAEMATRLREAWQSGVPLERIAGPWCRYCPILEECPEGQAVGAMLA